jgi:hypothetical protein
MTLPPSETPLYNHPLPSLEEWLISQGCEQDRENLHCWFVDRVTWQAEIYLEVEEIAVNYLNAEEGGADIKRSFKYSLSRKDVEAAVFSGP